MRQLRKIQQQNLPKWRVISLLKWRVIPLLKWGVIPLLIAIVLFSIFPAYIRLRKDSAEVHKKPTEENKREFDVSLANVQAITSSIGTIATIVGGAVLYLNFRVANRNAEIAEDKQVTERFSKAIEQLGNKEQLQVRLGGIYSLERIAKDSSKDLWTIVEVLSSFIREYAVTRSKGKARPSLLEAALQNQTATTNKPIKLPTDIKAAFTVIERIYKRHTDNQKIDLQGVDLSGTDLSGINLSSADLSGANLNLAKLSDVNLSNATLSLADFSSADLSGANLVIASLNGAKLRDAHLGFVDLLGANLFLADLSGANLSFANLSFANLSLANLSLANLSGVLILSTDLSDAEGLTKEQLEGQNPPYLYKVKLPPYITIDPNRDYEQVSQMLQKKYPKLFKTVKDAQKYIDSL